MSGIEPNYDHAGIRLYTGSALDVLRELPDASVQTCVTSPPFFGLRDYGTATWEGGNSNCGHRSPTMRDGRNEDRPMLAGSAATNAEQLRLAARSGCGKCGARRTDQQIGIEANPAEYLAALVAVFREVRRVLKPTGTFWCEIGDSYAGAGYSNHANTGGAQRADGGKQRHTNGTAIPAKSLLGIPWALAFALQDDGWILRSDIIWARPNPMPESVTDRPTKAHSYVFLLTKASRYYYDADAVAETAIHEGRVVKASGTSAKNGAGATEVNDRRTAAGFTKHDTVVTTRNARSVWTIPTEPTPFAHFATFPRELARRCILAGSAPGDTVLDPFSGAGTTCLVAKTLNRQAIGIELNPEYVALSVKRLAEPLLEWGAEQERQTARVEQGAFAFDGETA